MKLHHLIRTDPSVILQPSCWAVCHSQQREVPFENVTVLSMDTCYTNTAPVNVGLDAGGWQVGEERTEKEEEEEEAVMDLNQVAGRNCK